MAGERWGFAVFTGLVLVLLVNSTLVSANPDIMYEGDLFMINEWNQEDLVRLANESGFAIRIIIEPLICRDENWTLDESGNCEGGIPVSGPVYEYINSNNYTFSSAEKQINIDVNTLGIRFENDRFSVNFGDIIRIYPEQNFDLFSAKEMIETELKKLGLVDESFSLKLTAKEYSPPRLQGDSGTGYIDNIVIIISGIVIVVIIIGITIYRRK